LRVAANELPGGLLLNGHPVSSKIMNRPFLSRIGCFILMIGSLVLIIGIAAAFSDQPSFGLILAGLAVGFLGFLLWQRKNPEARRSTRFSLFKRAGRKDDSKEKQEQGE
jgi:hypothetical protein